MRSRKRVSFSETSQTIDCGINILLLKLRKILEIQVSYSLDCVFLLFRNNNGKIRNLCNLVSVSSDHPGALCISVIHHPTPRCFQSGEQYIKVQVLEHSQFAVSKTWTKVAIALLFYVFEFQDWSYIASFPQLRKPDFRPYQENPIIDGSFRHSTPLMCINLTATRWNKRW